MCTGDETELLQWGPQSVRGKDSVRAGKRVEVSGCRSWMSKQPGLQIEPVNLPLSGHVILEGDFISMSHIGGGLAVCAINLKLYKAEHRKAEAHRQRSLKRAGGLLQLRNTHVWMTPSPQGFKCLAGLWPPGAIPRQPRGHCSSSSCSNLKQYSCRLEDSW